MRKLLLLIWVFGMALPLIAAKAYTVVLDPGHGGKDPGAVGRFSQEKDLNLTLALEVGKLITKQYPDVKVVYTRSTDVFIPLQKRADIANKNNADLFISIHTNSSESKEPTGVETFILGTERMEANLDVAMRENAVMKLESDYKTTYQGFDPNSIDSYIMFELMQNSYMDQSLRFAEQVQKRFVGHLNRSDRGVRQAAFWVLLKTACPSILFEMGFISNPDEEKYLNQPASMAQMANAIVNAFAAYTHREAVKAEKLAIEPAPESTPPEQTPEPTPAEPSTNDQLPTTPSPPLHGEAGWGSTTIDHRPTQEPTVYYALQICAARTPLDPTDSKLKGVPCQCRKVGDWYKYYAIIDTDRSKVVEKQKEIKKLFPDCWITKFENK